MEFSVEPNGEYESTRTTPPTPIFRVYQHNEARENTTKSQKKQKVRFDFKIQPEEFEIGDKV
ncbi:hypothetical protein C2G38_2229293 [Gigaspora rosea]|uniref:Uncharacterized protein n=1 Tax=Gigaspora rosea TaxID=44941 RepID=A0A397TY98_9GLOM|nr:hypothetical protein C2G38_2229293 [Gigaspora rosea]